MSFRSPIGSAFIASRRPQHLAEADAAAKLSEEDIQALISAGRDVSVAVIEAASRGRKHARKHAPKVVAPPPPPPPPPAPRTPWGPIALGVAALAAVLIVTSGPSRSSGGQ